MPERVGLRRVEIQRGHRLDPADERPDRVLAGRLHELVRVAGRDRVGELHRIRDPQGEEHVHGHADAVRGADLADRDVEGDLARGHQVRQGDHGADPAVAGGEDVIVTAALHDQADGARGHADEQPRQQPDHEGDDRPHDDHGAQGGHQRQEQPGGGEADRDEDPDGVDRWLTTNPHDHRHPAVLIATLDGIGGIEWGGLGLRELDVRLGKHGGALGGRGPRLGRHVRHAGGIVGHGWVLLWLMTAGRTPGWRFR